VLSLCAMTGGTWLAGDTTSGIRRRPWRWLGLFPITPTRHRVYTRLSIMRRVARWKWIDKAEYCCVPKAIGLLMSNKSSLINIKTA
jgi:hypothetical protein